MPNPLDLKTTLQQEAKNLHIDLIGVAPIERFAAAPDRQKPQTIMPDAKSVIVLARRFLSGPLKYHHWTSYTTVHDGNTQRLDNDAYTLALFLEKEFAAQAIPIPAMAPYFHWDETKQYASGDLSHKHAAVAAGLGIMGKNHLLITPQYGNRVNLVSLITDLDITPDPLLEQKLCPAACRLCIEACPVKALSPNQPIQQSTCRGHCWTKLPRGFSVLQCWKCREICPAGLHQK
jgi:epoxyqueuosine reductase QueG